MATNEQRKEWKRIGLCSCCGKRRPVEGGLTCQGAVIGIRQTEIIRESTGYVLNVVKIALLLIANIVMIVSNGDERDIKQKSKTQSVLMLLD